MFYRILTSILLPIECLIDTRLSTNDEFERATIFNLNWVLSTSKIECANIKTIKRIIEILKESIMKVSLIVAYWFLFILGTITILIF